jgi:hypothetical protein
MIQWLLSPANTPFTIAFAVFLLLLVLEVVTMFAGFAFSQVVEGGLDLDVDADAGVTDHGLHVDVPGGLDSKELPWTVQTVAWFHIGSVPLVFLTMLMLAGFGMTGFTIQSLTAGRLHPLLASVPAFVVGVMAVRWIGGLAAKHVFKDDSSAVSEDSLIGHSATITLGATERGNPTQAKLIDKFGQTHYVLIEPLRDDDQFAAGATVILVKRDGPKYYVIEESVDALLNLGPEDLQAEHRQQA